MLLARFIWGFIKKGELVLIDAAGRIRAYYQPSEKPEAIDQLVEDIRWLLNEDPQP